MYGKIFFVFFLLTRDSGWSDVFTSAPCFDGKNVKNGLLSDKLIQVLCLCEY